MRNACLACAALVAFAAFPAVAQPPVDPHSAWHPNSNASIAAPTSPPSTSVPTAAAAPQGWQSPPSGQTRDTYRLVPVPVTEYRWEAYWKGRWNPLRTPQVAYRLRPYSYWEYRTHILRTPLAPQSWQPIAPGALPANTAPQGGAAQGVTPGSQVALPGQLAGMTPPATVNFAPPGNTLAPAASSSAIWGGLASYETDPPRTGWLWNRSTRVPAPGALTTRTDPFGGALAGNTLGGGSPQNVSLPAEALRNARVDSPWRPRNESSFR